MMPTPSEHEAKYFRNKRILNDPFFSISMKANYDWAITIMFYCAVHLVEKALAEISPKYNTTTHRARRNLLLAERKRFAVIFSQYQALYNQSIRARYEYVSFSRKDFELAANYLKHIETHLSHTA